MTTQHPAASASLDLDDLKKTAKDALRDLSHIELHLEKSEAPKTILNRAVDVRLCIKELRDALARRATHQPSEAASAGIDIETIRQVADELELEAQGYEGDFADAVSGCADALRRLINNSSSPAGEDKDAGQEGSGA